MKTYNAVNGVVECTGGQLGEFVRRADIDVIVTNSDQLTAQVVDLTNQVKSVAAQRDAVTKKVLDREQTVRAAIASLGSVLN